MFSLTGVVFSNILRQVCESYETILIFDLTKEFLLSPSDCRIEIHKWTGIGLFSG
jgi:hypothetical protein